MLSTIVAPVRRAVRVTGLAGVTATLLPAYMARDLVTPEPVRHELRDRWIRRWTSAVLRLFQIDLMLVGEPPRPSGGRLVVANHRSTIDIGLILRTFGGHLVSRADLADWPFIGFAARRVGTIFVDRKAAMSGAGAIRTVRQLLREGRTVSIFPEGTTFAGDEVRPFLPGGFVAAVGTDAHVLPVGIAYGGGSRAAFVGESFPAHLARIAAAPPSRVAMAIGEPLRVTEQTRSAQLSAQAQAAVQQLVGVARKACDGR